jgi:hypothetical protein
MTMGRAKTLLTALLVLASAAIFNSDSGAQTTPTDDATPTPDNAVMITIFFKHDESRPLGELNAQLEKQGYYKAFPPAGVEVVSWYVMMGIGQVVTLTPTGLAAPRGQPHHREPGLGRLSHRILSDLRLQGGRARRARKGAVKGEAEGKSFPRDHDPIKLHRITISALCFENGILGKPATTPLSKCGTGFFRIMPWSYCVISGFIPSSWFEDWV